MGLATYWCILSPTLHIRIKLAQGLLHEMQYTCIPSEVVQYIEHSRIDKLETMTGFI